MTIWSGDMKTLIVYVKDSYYKFEDLYHKHLYVIDNGILYLYVRNEIDGSETVIASFRTWDYFLIDED